MLSYEKRFREIRTYSSQLDDILYLYVCFAQIPHGGFICPYVEIHTGSHFQNTSEDNSVLRKRLAEEIIKPQCTVYPTLDAAIDAFDLTHAYKP